MKLYAMCSDDLNEIQDQLNNMAEDDDNYGLPVKTSPSQNVPRSKCPQVKTSPSNVLIKPKHITKEMFYY